MHITMETNLSSTEIPPDLSPNATLTLPPDMVFGDAQIISIAAYTPLFIISATLNLRVLANLLRVKERSGLSRLNQLLLHLVLADLSVTFLMMPLEIAWAITVSWWAGDFLCRLCSFFRIFGLFLSSNIVVCISVDRFLAILRPFSVRGSSRRIKWMLAVAWGMAVVLSLPQCMVFSLKFHPKFIWYGQCVTYGSFDNRLQEFLYFFMGMVFLYIIPLIVIILTYGGIICHLHRKDIRWTRDEETDQPSPTYQSPPNETKPQKSFSMKLLRPKSCKSGGKTVTTPTTTTTTAMSMTSTGIEKIIIPGKLNVPEPDLETTSTSRQRSPSSTPMVIRRSNPGMIGKAKLNTIKITMTLVGVFLACWTPYYVLCIWFWVAPESYNKIDFRIQKFLFLYACTNSCANPLIYGAFSTNGAGLFTNKERAPTGRRWLSQKFRRGPDPDDRQRASSASVVLHRKRSAVLAKPRNHESEVMPTRQNFRLNFSRRRSEIASDVDTNSGMMNIDRDPRLSKKFRFMEMRNFKRSQSRPINVTVNVHVNGFRLNDYDIQAEIEKHENSLVLQGGDSRPEEMIERIDNNMIKEVSSSAENDSSEQKKSTEV